MKDQSMIWGYLIHLSYNFWQDRDAPVFRDSPEAQAQNYLRCDDSLWRDITARMHDIGMNMLVIDVGDGVLFSSHPEIAVEGAWSTTKLKEELARLRDMGIEPIPKLNFSAGHDVWLKEYARMVSTKEYYRVCGDLISETAELFDGPRFFHLGMDEENAEIQKHTLYTVIRQHELLWHDLSFFFDAVRTTGAKPWLWSDYMWKHQEEYLQLMPKDVIQSNWYYEGKFSDFEEGHRFKTWLEAFDVLDQHGYLQMPCASNFYNEENIHGLLEYCRSAVDKERLLGFLIAPWRLTTEDWRDNHMAALQQTEDAKKIWDGLTQESA